ncbi:sugar ABC transporter ATP-binding protein [Diplocloster modestus]|uniref:Sugar ABC transporter ATP-binding protein n=1 Tax=Diplocloster modestus TaxID=2850322 RepID=A0ABS6KDR0_9FIRM|nr:sugar ABC transporter ATP-binding protein [Diplocloster modestus]MBU9728647.1 sugar ABC transporter ATP-binding protein [Diplocloster modestus]
MAEKYMKNDHIVSDEIVMEAKGICKSFPGVKALSDVDITIHKGEVVALLGENGAGKSTLIKVLSGIYKQEIGTVAMEGKEMNFELPSDATNAGIGVIHQELNYVSTISVAENIFMGNIPKKYGLVDYKTMYRQSKEILSLVGLTIDPKINIGDCSVAQKQLIEIAKVMSNNAKVLILDEPTSALNDIEVGYLFQLIHKAASEGVSIFYISHKLDELFEVADRVVVMRDGCVTGQIDMKEATNDLLISKMVGRELDDMYPKIGGVVGEVALQVENLTTDSLKSVSFEARNGEILGIYGLMGSGHQAIGSALYGQDIVHEGKIRINNKNLIPKTPLDAINAGLAYVPAERKTEGLVLNQSVAVNTMAGYYSKSHKKILNNRLEIEKTKKWVDKFSIKTPTIDTAVESLSGGNQQKVILSRCLELDPDVLILNEPTRGIDVGAKSEIYRILDQLCQEGKCVIIITSEMPELLAMSDKIMVMSDGQKSGFLNKDEATQELVVQYAIGG